MSDYENTYENILREKFISVPAKDYHIAEPHNAMSHDCWFDANVWDWIQEQCDQGTYLFGRNHCWFENDEDAVMFKLLYGN